MLMNIKLLKIADCINDFKQLWFISFIKLNSHMKHLTDNIDKIQNILVKI